jgi:hypothetical protein
VRSVLLVDRVIDALAVMSFWSAGLLAPGPSACYVLLLLCNGSTKLVLDAGLSRVLVLICMRCCIRHGACKLLDLVRLSC